MHNDYMILVAKSVVAFFPSLFISDTGVIRFIILKDNKA